MTTFCTFLIRIVKYYRLVLLSLEKEHSEKAKTFTLSSYMFSVQREKYMAQPRSELLRTLTKSSMHVLETLTYWIRAIQISILVTWTANAALEDQRLRQQGSPPSLVSCDLHPVPLTVQASLQWPLPCHSRPEPVEGLQWSLPCRCLCESDQVL